VLCAGVSLAWQHERPAQLSGRDSVMRERVRAELIVRVDIRRGRILLPARSDWERKGQTRDRREQYASVSESHRDIQNAVVSSTPRRGGQNSFNTVRFLSWLPGWPPLFVPPGSGY